MECFYRENFSKAINMIAIHMKIISKHFIIAELRNIPTDCSNNGQIDLIKFD